MNVKDCTTYIRTHKIESNNKNYVTIQVTKRLRKFLGEQDFYENRQRCNYIQTSPTNFIQSSLTLF